MRSRLPLRARSSTRSRPSRHNAMPCLLEPCEARRLYSVTATFAPASHTLTILGDAANNAITVSRDKAGKIAVKSGGLALAIVGGAPTVANTSLVSVFGQAGNDTILLDEANGPLPAANLFGGSGNDALTGGSGNDQLFGQSGNDTLTGRAGNDLLFGGDDADVLGGGIGTDQVFGESGDDRLRWNPGDESDLDEGGAGTDTVEVNGNDGDEAFTVTANGTRVRFDRLTAATFSLDIGTTEKLVLKANGGNDTFSATGNLAPLIQITVDGGAGNDRLSGSNGADTLTGGDGIDFIDGQQGNDTVLLGSGDDTFQWDPGDGSDVVEGGTGNDTMQFNGANIAENFDVSANAGRVRFTRNVGNITMDLNDVEVVNVTALGGADAVTVGDLTGTDLKELNLNLSAFDGTGDGSADIVTVNGTADDDAISIVGVTGRATVLGLPVTVTVAGAEPANDRLVVNGLAGDDVLEAHATPADSIQLTLDGGDGSDVLVGGAGNDTLLGGNNDDVLIGGPGLDVLDGGTGDNVLLQD